MNKFKPGYTLSKTEFTLIVGLLAVAVIVLSANYFLLPQYTQLQGTIRQYESQQTLLNNLKAEYAKLDSYKQQDDTLGAQLKEFEQAVPAYYSQEEIVSALDDASSKSSLRLLGISFGGVTTNNESSFLDGLKQSSAAKNETAKKGNDKNSGKTEKESQIVSERVTLSYTGTYKNLVDFMAAFESGNRQVSFRNMTMNRADDSTLTGSLILLFYGRLGEHSQKDTAYPGYDYAVKAPAGKSDPFAAFAGYGQTAASPAAEDTPEFFVILNTYDDNASKVIMGNYPVSSTQIGSETNGIVSATLTVGLSDGKYTYTYQLDGSSRSGTFDIAGNALSLSVLSRARKSSLDKVGMKLDVINNTDKTLVVNVKNEDSTKPRFQLGATTGSVKVA